MATYKVLPPFPVMTDIDGSPLESGYIYIGEEGLDPENNPISVYFDLAQTQPASQPIRTINGYPSNAGTPAKLFAASADYSIRVKNRNSTTVYTSLTADAVQDVGEYSVFDFLTTAQITDVTTRAMAIDLTTAIQAAIDFVSGVKGTLRFPSGSYKGNYVIKSDVLICGDGQAATLFYPASDAPIFKTQLTVSTVRIGFNRLGIVGDNSFTSNSGILLKTTTGGTFVDTIDINEIRVTECGSYGLRAEGVSSSGPFVQRLHISNSTFIENENCGISIVGTVLETGIINTFCVKNGGSAGTNANAEAILGTGSPARIAFINCAFNHFNALDAGNTGTALKLQHCTEVNILSCDFESADPYIQVSGSLARSINIIGNRFGSAYNATSGIEINDCNGIVIQGNSFQSPTGTLTNGIYSSTNINRTKQISVSDIAKTNVFSGNITNPVNISYTATVATGVIYAYKDYFRLETEGSGAADDLDYIYDDSGTASTARLVTGQYITLRGNNAARVVTIKHGTGNINTKSGADIVLSAVRITAVFMWDASLSLWIEVS